MPVGWRPMVRRTLAFTDTHVLEVATVVLESVHAGDRGVARQVAPNGSPGHPSAPTASPVRHSQSHESDGACAIRKVITWSAPLADVDAIRSTRAAVLRPSPLANAAGES